MRRRLRVPTRITFAAGSRSENGRPTMSSSCSFHTSGMTRIVSCAGGVFCGGTDDKDKATANPNILLSGGKISLPHGWCQLIWACQKQKTLRLGRLNTAGLHRSTCEYIQKLNENRLGIYRSRCDGFWSPLRIGSPSRKLYG